MSENPVLRHWKTIAAKIDALSKSHDERFASIDRPFESIDQRFAETRAQLGVKIEAVDTKSTRTSGRSSAR